MSGPSEITVGAVAYHPRVVTVWEGFRDYFRDRGVPTDYVLYSNYERLAQALLEGAVEIAWNTNTAFVAVERQIDGQALILGMRDIDAEFATVIVTVLTFFVNRAWTFRHHEPQPVSGTR